MRISVQDTTLAVLFSFGSTNSKLPQQTILPLARPSKPKESTFFPSPMCASSRWRWLSRKLPGQEEADDVVVGEVVGEEVQEVEVVESLWWSMWWSMCGGRCVRSRRCGQGRRWLELEVLLDAEDAVDVDVVMDVDVVLGPELLEVVEVQKAHSMRSMSKTWLMSFAVVDDAVDVEDVVEKDVVRCCRWELEVVEFEVDERSLWWSLWSVSSMVSMSSTASSGRRSRCRCSPV
eukprot:4706700-Amphidinium_carterae.1